MPVATIKTIADMLSAVRFGLTRAITTTNPTRFPVYSRRTLVHVKGRPYLPGSDGANFPEYLQEFSDVFPHVIQVPDIKKTNLKSFAKDFIPNLKESIEKYAAVLVRGLPLESGHDFSQFYRSLDLVELEYIGGSGTRTEVAKSVWTASEDQSSYSIEPHNEMAYYSIWPNLIFLYCDVPPAPGCGGESGITDVRKIYADLDQEVKDKLNEKGVRYHIHMEDKAKSVYYSWQASLQAETREEAEEILTNDGLDFAWDENGGLTYFRTSPAMSPHWRTGEMLWFNQAHTTNASYYKYHPTLAELFKDLPDTKYPSTTFYGDGSAIEPEVLQNIRDVSWKNTIVGQLKKGDVLVLDNMLMQHSRLSFKGERKLMIALAKFKD